MDSKTPEEVAGEALKAALRRIVEYAREGNEQAVTMAQVTRDRRWSGKSHAYVDVLEFIENEVMPEIDGDKGFHE